MYRLLCLDIDGTLLNSRHQITPGVKAAIQSAERSGCCVALVSARMPKGMRSLSQELGLKTPLLCYSGAFILDPAENVLWQKQIPADLVRTLWTHTRQQKLHLSLYEKDHWYIEEDDFWSGQESDITHITPQIIDYGKQISVWEKNSTGPNKLLCMAEPEKINQLLALLPALPLTIYRSKPTYLEIGSPEASKTKAIEVLAAQLGIAREEIICIGDNFNDRDMLEYAGLGIAMGNAPAEVQACADVVTAGNDEDGVARAIEKYYFGK